MHIFQGGFVYELRTGEVWTFFGGMVIVAHPERPPNIVYGKPRIRVRAPTERISMSTYHEQCFLRGSQWTEEDMRRMKSRRPSKPTYVPNGRPGGLRNWMGS